jgi:membrane associated rhomboid family serine protease
MIGDRDYMRDPDGYRAPMTMSAKLIIAMVGVFALQCVDLVYLRGALTRTLALTRDGLMSGFIWQLFSFQLLHAGLFHLFINGFVLWMIGRFVEGVLGPRRYLVAFFGCGLLGGLMQAALMLVLPKMYGTHLVGASAGVGGLFAILALLFRNQTVLVFFILPARAITLLYVFLGIAAFFTLVPAGGNVAHAAHLGGMLGGMLFVRLGWHQEFVALPWDGWLGRLRRRSSARSRRPFIEVVRSADGAKSAAPVSERGAAAEDSPEFITSQVDPILDKISAQGLHSLTEREREILEKARNRLGR